MTQREKMGEEIRSTDAHVHARSLSLSRTHAQGNSIRGELLSPLDQATPSRQEEEALL